MEYCRKVILGLMLGLSLPAFAQWQIGSRSFAPTTSGFTPISLEASCVGTGTATNNPCSTTMTVSAGDLIIAHCYTNNASFDPSNIHASDGLNGEYRALVNTSHPAIGNDRTATFYFENSAAGTITPQCSNWEPDGMGIIARAYKNVRPTQALDGSSAINLINISSSTSTTPSAGTAGAPTNSNEVIDCSLVLTSSTTVTAGSGYTQPTTGAINTLGAYQQYVVNPSTANCPFSLAAAKSFTDVQVAGLHSSNPAGYVGVTGFYGAPVAAQTNGATASLAILNDNNTGTVNTLNGNPANTWWSLLAGSATTFDTSVHPLGSLNLLVNGKAHTLGDAGASIKIPSSDTTTAYNYAQEGLISNGNGSWALAFMRLGSNATSGEFCDNINLDATIAGGNFTYQVYFDSTNKIHFQFERAQGNTPTVTGMIPSTPLNTTTDFAAIVHVAGINEANDELYIFREATPSVLPWVLTDHFTAPKSGQVIATTTASASSGATFITVASATNVVIGQSVYSATTSVDTGQIPLGAKVTSVSGTTIGISAATTASMSGTPVEFAGNAAYQTCSVTAGSTTLTCGSGTGIVGGGSNTGQFVAMAGVATGTWVASGSGTTWTLSQPAISTQTSVAAQFWNPDGSTFGMHFGKYSSCTSTADVWYSGMIFDPYGTLLPQIANGNLPL